MCSQTVASRCWLGRLGDSVSFISIRFEVAVFFFFSSRRRHTRFDCDWSSDVCSSDLSYRFWAVGSVAGRGLDVAGQVLPFAVLGLVLAAFNARDLDLLALGDDVAAEIGRASCRERV